MTDRVLTLADLDSPAASHGQGRYRLRVLERRLRQRVAVLDRRVDDLLHAPGIPTMDDVARVDILCASIGELQELMDEARREAAGRSPRV